MHFDILASFCTQNQMEVNLEKSKVILVSTRSKFYLFYKVLQLEQGKSYKYLDIKFSHNYSWALCMQKIV